MYLVYLGIELRSVVKFGGKPFYLLCHPPCPSLLNAARRETQFPALCAANPELLSETDARHACAYLSSQLSEAEAGGLCVRGQAKLHSSTPSQDQKKQQKQFVIRKRGENDSVSKSRISKGTDTEWTPRISQGGWVVASPADPVCAPLTGESN